MTDQALATAPTVTAGSCTRCREPIDRIYDPANPCFWRDGHRYQYAAASRFATDANARHPVYCIFRCEGCGEPIEENWKATPPGAKS